MSKNLYGADEKALTDAFGKAFMAAGGKKASGEGPSKGSHSPWGSIQSVTVLGNEVWSVGTAGHGGVKLSRRLNALIPADFRGKGGWYEEDTEWAIPYFILPASEFGADLRYTENLKGAESSIKNWNPDLYEKKTGKKLKLEESLTRRNEDFYEKSKHSWVVNSASGDWHPKVPKGMVGVAATIGGRDMQGRAHGPEKFFLVPEAEYAERGRSFIVDPSKHKEIDKL